jgi:hypothetical protein
MALNPFIPESRIKQIRKELGDDTCGSLSACVVLEYLNISYDIAKVKKDSRDGIATVDYPIDGSNIFGVALAIAKHENISVKICSNMQVQDIKTKVACYIEPILNELIPLPNVIFDSPITIDALLPLISPTTIPILAFSRNGKSERNHFSPLIGLKGFSILSFPVGETDQNDILIDKHIFEATCWDEKLCLLVTKTN